MKQVNQVKDGQRKVLPTVCILQNTCSLHAHAIRASVCYSRQRTPTLNLAMLMKSKQENKDMASQSIYLGTNPCSQIPKWVQGKVRNLGPKVGLDCPDTRSKHAHQSGQFRRRSLVPDSAMQMVVKYEIGCMQTQMAYQGTHSCNYNKKWVHGKVQNLGAKVGLNCPDTRSKHVHQFGQFRRQSLVPDSAMKMVVKAGNEHMQTSTTQQGARAWV